MRVDQRGEVAAAQPRLGVPVGVAVAGRQLQQPPDGGAVHALHRRAGLEVGAPVLQEEQVEHRLAQRAAPVQQHVAHRRVLLALSAPRLVVAGEQRRAALATPAALDHLVVVDGAEGTRREDELRLWRVGRRRRLLHGRVEVERHRGPVVRLFERALAVGGPDQLPLVLDMDLPPGRRRLRKLDQHVHERRHVVPLTVLALVRVAVEAHVRVVVPGVPQLLVK